MGFPLPQCLRGAAEPLSFGLFLSGRLFAIASQTEARQEKLFH